MRRRYLSILLAVALAALGLVAIVTWVNGAEQRAVDRTKAVTVLAASKPIPAGTTVTQATDQHDVTKIRYPAGSLPRDYVTRFTVEEYKEVFTSGLEPEQLILSGMLGSKSLTAPGLAIPEHMQSVTITVCQGAAVGGFIGSGSSVTVLDTAGIKNPLQFSCDSHQPPAGGSRTTVVLPEALVLKVIATPPATQTTGGITPLGTPGDPGCAAASQGEVCVTVAVTGTETLRLQDFNAVGDLSLVLLGPDSVPPKLGSSWPPSTGG